MIVKKIIIVQIIFTLLVFANNYYTNPLFQDQAFQKLLTKEIISGYTAEYDDPCIYVDDEYLKIETPLLKYILKKEGYIFPTQREFDKLIKKYFPKATQKKISRINALEYSKRDFYVNDVTSWGIDIIILRKEQFITLPYRLPEVIFVSKISKKMKELALKIEKKPPSIVSPWKIVRNAPKGEKFKNISFILSLNKYLFNHDATQFRNLIKKNLYTLSYSGLLDPILNKASLGDIGFFFQFTKKEKYFKENREEWLRTLHYKRVFLNNHTHKSLYSFCKTTGIKESEIRALNPWINKKATNIPPNAEIIIPNKEEK